MTLDELRKQDIADIEQLMEIASGRRFIARIIQMSGVFRISFNPASNEVTAFNEGQRNIGNMVFGDVQNVPNYMNMLEDATAQRVLDEEDFNA